MWGSLINIVGIFVGSHTRSYTDRGSWKPSVSETFAYTNAYLKDTHVYGKTEGYDY